MNLLEVKTNPPQYVNDMSNSKYIAVTLDGTVIHPSGLMTGGSAPTQPVTKWHESEVEG